MSEETEIQAKTVFHKWNFMNKSDQDFFSAKCD